MSAISAPLDALCAASSVLVPGIEPWGVGLICLLVFLAGYVDAIAGGGGLISLPAYLIAGVPTHAAIATNKLSSSLGTAVATWHYARAGFINPRLAAPCIVCALAGSVAGASLVLLVDDAFLRMILLVVLPCTAWWVMRSKRFGAGDVDPFSARKTLVLCMLIAAGIGVYDGFYGPGTGTFLMLLLGGVARLRLDAAAGITKAINLTTNVAALAVFLVHGQTMVALGLLAGAFSIVGNYLGSHRFTRDGGAVARPIVVTVLVIFFLKVVWDFATL